MLTVTCCVTEFLVFLGDGVVMMTFLMSDRYQGACKDCTDWCTLCTAASGPCNAVPGTCRSYYSGQGKY